MTIESTIDNMLQPVHGMPHPPWGYRDRIVIDTSCPGLRFVASPDRSGGSWVRRYKNRTGKMRQYVFGNYPEVSLDQARQYIESVRGQDNPVKRLFGEPTIGMLIDRYINEYIKAYRRDDAIRSVRSALIRNLKPISGQTLDQVTAAMLHELIMDTKKRAPSMARLMRSELKQAWSYGLSIGMTNLPCPVSTLTGGRFRKKSRDNILNDDQVRLLLDNLALYSPRLAAVIIICLYTGLRSGEAVQLRSNWFELIDGVLWLTLPGDRMKNGMPHRVPIIGRAETVINNHIIDYKDKGSAGCLFPLRNNDQRHITQVALAREVYAVKTPVGRWRLHDLRRTTRTNLQRIGCPFEISETILAHKLPGVSSVYARYQYNDEKIEWLSKLADYYVDINDLAVRT